MKHHMRFKNTIRNVAVMAGICLCLYPVLSSFLEGEHLKNVVSTYESSVEKVKEEEAEQMLHEAEEYNDILYQEAGSIASKPREERLHEKRYENLLNLSDTGIMGTIEIPKISVNLPIYHGTTEEVLSIGIGHLEGSSLPVGGKNTHSILTGHRGLPNAKLFTRLDELEKGDLFYIQVGNKTLAYRVNDIKVIKPEDAEELSIKADKDEVSLITCTPYGINSHRLVVTGERTQYKDTEYLAIEPRAASIREIGFLLLPCIMAGVVTAKYIKERKERECAK